MLSDSAIELQIPASSRGLRLDRALADLIPDQSRSTIRRWIDDGYVRLDGKQPRARYSVGGGEQVTIQVPAPDSLELQPEAMDLDVVFDDASILVINKPAGLVVHPGAGNWSGTLVNGLLGFDESLAVLPRAGLVHRLDKDTSGLLVVARTEQARIELVERLSLRQIDRHYIALVDGEMIAGGIVNQPIGRDPHDRRRMTVRAGGRESVTHYRVRQRFSAHTLLDLKLESGRTHQIRVHMKWLKYPVTGDPVYGGRPRLPAGASAALASQLGGFSRQALHATVLRFNHPKSGDGLVFEAPMPLDMDELVTALQNHQQKMEN